MAVEYFPSLSNVCPLRMVAIGKKLWSEKTAPIRNEKGNNMRIKTTKGIRPGKAVTAVLLAGLLCALPPSTQAQFFGGFGGATSLAGAATLGGAATLAGATS